MTRRHALLAALALTALAGCEVTAEPQHPAVVTTSSTTTTSTTVLASGEATIGRVIDGDTVELAGGDRVRIIGVDTPERGDCWFDQASDALAALTPPGTPITLIRDRTDRDRYGRLLRYIEASPVGDVGAQLVVNGHAQAKQYKPDTARADEYQRLQTIAEHWARGMWAPKTAGGCQ